MTSFLKFELAIVAAAIGRIDQLSVYAEEPASRNVDVGRLFDVYNIIGPRSRQVEEVTNISTIKTCLKMGKGVSSFYNDE